MEPAQAQPHKENHMNATSANAAIDKASSAAHSAIDDAARIARVPVDRMATIAHDASEKPSARATRLRIGFRSARKSSLRPRRS